MSHISLKGLLPTAMVRGLLRRIRRTAFPQDKDQRCRPSTFHRRDTGHTLIILLLHPVTSHLLRATLMATGNRPISPLIIPFTPGTPPWPSILPIQGRTFLPRPARRLQPPRSKQPTHRRRLQTRSILPQGGEGRRKGDWAVRMTRQSPQKSPKNLSVSPTWLARWR